MEEQEDEGFPAQVGISKRGSHPLLIYRLTEDEDLCFKFMWKRTNKADMSYVCLGCQSARDGGHECVVTSIRVKNNRFLSDPEALDHGCIDHDYTYEYLEADVQQELR